MITNIDELAQDEAVAYFKADLCLSDPDNYTLDEKREICEEMAATSEAIPRWEDVGFRGRATGPNQLIKRKRKGAPADVGRGARVRRPGYS